MLKKVLILSAAVGAGHLRAAEAIEKAFKQLNLAEEVKNIDVLNYNLNDLGYCRGLVRLELICQSIHCCPCQLGS